MAAPAAAAAPVYIGGVALAYGFMYAVSPEFRQAHNSLGEAMVDGASNAYEDVTDLIFGEDDVVAPSTPTTGTQTQTQTDAATDTATDTARCPALPFIHYTDPTSAGLIMGARTIVSGVGGGVYLANTFYGPYTVWSVLFIGSMAYTHKPFAFVQLMADCTAPIALRTSLSSIMPEYFHPGALRERPPNVVFTTSGPNIFPEHPYFEGMTVPGFR